jgi:hypothetical protein
MPKRPSACLDTFFLEPELYIDAAPSARASLHANILRQLFIEAAKIARDNPSVHDDCVVRRLLRGAARIEAWRSGSPLLAHRHPPPQISPAPTPEASPELEDDYGPAIFLACLNCSHTDCSDVPYCCWRKLSERQQRALIDEHERVGHVPPWDR